MAAFSLTNYMRPPKDYDIFFDIEKKLTEILLMLLAK